ncbi:ABC transporter permease [Allisonella histaminiformans]|uniref:ABC transporter permease n=1 Tax=Allisonella histaminiformans TaxID=209880 RepID=UPI0026EAD324|nr:ABC transporter permease [Allisonella histaminiformans]
MDNILFYLRRILFIIRKEFLATVNDPKSRVILVVPAIIQTLLFGYVASFNLDRVDYALLDMSHSQYSEDFAAHLEGSGIFQRVATLGNTGQIAQFIDNGEVSGVVVIPADFADKLVQGQTSPIQVITDGRNTVISSLAYNYVATIATSYNQDIHLGKHLLTVDSITWYNPNQITRWNFLPSLLPMISLIQVMLLSGLSVAREREQGTFDQLMVTPLTSTEILAGKAVPPLVIGLMQSCIVLVFAVFWFHVHVIGNLITLFIVMFIFLLSCVGLGLAISANSKNMQQVMVYNFVVLVPIILLSGLATPVRNMPQVLQYFTYINPMRFAIDAVRRVYIEGASLAAVSPDLLPMVVITLVTMPFAAWMFRNKLG